MPLSGIMASLGLEAGDEQQFVFSSDNGDIFLKETPVKSTGGRFRVQLGSRKLSTCFE